MQSQLRNFVFTWNNPYGNQGIADKEDLYGLYNNPHFSDECCGAFLIREMWINQDLPISYIVFGLEKGEEKNTLHLQGYCELSKRVSFAVVKKYFSRCHLEPRMGSQQQAIAYSKKQGYFIEYGVPKVQGDRADLQHIKSMLDDNSSIKALLEDGTITSSTSLRTA